MDINALNTITLRKLFQHRQIDQKYSIKIPLYLLMSHASKRVYVNLHRFALPDQNVRRRADAVREAKSHWYGVSTWGQFPLVLDQQVTKNDLDLGSSEEPARASMFALPKSQVIRARGDQQSLSLRLSLLPHSEEPVRVPFVGVFVQFWIYLPS